MIATERRSIVTNSLYSLSIIAIEQLYIVTSVLLHSVLIATDQSFIVTTALLLSVSDSDRTALYCDHFTVTVCQC